VTRNNIDCPIDSSSYLDYTGTNTRPIMHTQNDHPIKLRVATNPAPYPLTCYAAQYHMRLPLIAYPNFTPTL